MAARVVNMTIPESLIRIADEIAQEEGRTRSELVREAVREYVQSRRGKRKSGSRVLSHLAALAVKGPDLSARDLDRLLYGKGKSR